jgi:nucleoside-diphosphate-sugar epimerase
MASVFVTGGSGYIGSAVCERLAAAGHRVSGLARSGASAERLRAIGVEPVRADIGDQAALGAAAKSSDGTVHVAAGGPESGACDLAAVKTLIEALAGSDKPLVYTSCAWVMGSTNGRLAGEMWPCKPPPSVAWRLSAEKLVLDAADRKVCGVVIRPAMVYGRGGGLAARFAGREVPMIGDGRNHWSFVHVEDLGDLYLKALENARAGTLYIGQDGTPITTAEFARAFGITDFLPLDRARQRLGEIADCLVVDLKVGSTRAFRELGWRPSKPSVLRELRRA